MGASMPRRRGGPNLLLEDFLTPTKMSHERCRRRGLGRIKGQEVVMRGEGLSHDTHTSTVSLQGELMRVK